jgi:hypothetical protein
MNAEASLDLRSAKNARRSIALSQGGGGWQYSSPPPWGVMRG